MHVHFPTVFGQLMARFKKSFSPKQKKLTPPQQTQQILTMKNWIHSHGIQ